MTVPTKKKAAGKKKAASKKPAGKKKLGGKKSAKKQLAAGKKVGKKKAATAGKKASKKKSASKQPAKAPSSRAKTDAQSSGKAKKASKKQSTTKKAVKAELALPDGYTRGEKSAPYRFGPSAIEGMGVFAIKAIAAGEYIGEYKGPVTTENDTHVLWVFEEDGTEHARDGKNGLRYLNHSQTPNAEFDGFELYAMRAIAVGEEIVFDYGDPELDFY